MDEYDPLLDLRDSESLCWRGHQTAVAVALQLLLRPPAQVRLPDNSQCQLEYITISKNHTW